MGMFFGTKQQSPPSFQTSEIVPRAQFPLLQKGGDRIYGRKRFLEVLGALWEGKGPRGRVKGCRMVPARVVDTPLEGEGVKERPGPRGPGRRLARARAALGTVNIRRNGRHAGHPVGSCEEGGGEVGTVTWAKDMIRDEVLKWVRSSVLIP